MLQQAVGALWSMKECLPNGGFAYWENVRCRSSMVAILLCFWVVTFDRIGMTSILGDLLACEVNNKT